MKKIVSILLVAVMMLLLASCQPAGDTDISTYKNALSATDSKEIVVSAKYTSLAFTDIELESEYTVTLLEDGSATVEFWYDVLNDSSSDSTDLITRHPGSATIAANGTVSGDDLPASVTAGAKISFNLDQSKFKSMNEAHGILTAEILSANTEAVLGFKVDADVTLTLRITNDGKLGSASIAYATESENVSISILYN